MTDKHKGYMQAAIKKAQDAAKMGEVPIGAVIVLRENDQIIATGENRTIIDNDPTAHAEIVAIRRACEKLGAQRIPECDLYVTLEPCTMCAAAIAFARIGTLVFGALDEKGGAVVSGVRFFDQPTCHHKITVTGPTEEAGDIGAMLKSFFKARR